MMYYLILLILVPLLMIGFAVLYVMFTSRTYKLLRKISKGTSHFKLDNEYTFVYRVLDGQVFEDIEVEWGLEKLLTEQYKTVRDIRSKALMNRTSIKDFYKASNTMLYLGSSERTLPCFIPVRLYRWIENELVSRMTNHRVVTHPEFTVHFIASSNYPIITHVKSHTYSLEDIEQAHHNIKL